MSPWRPHRALVGALAAVVLAACSAAAESGDDTGTDATTAASDASTAATDAITAGTPALTVEGVGVLPGPLPTNDVAAIASTTTIAEIEESKTIGAQAAGNRVLMLGDSILASTSKRYGDEMCNALVPLGWQVDIEAEVGRPVAFGQQVMKERWDEGWDAGLVFLGNNYDGKQDDFYVRFTALIDAFEGKPVVVLTVTENKDQQTQVNEIITAVAAARPNVTIIDWKTISTYEGVRGKDGLHLTDLGRRVLADTVAPVFDVAPAQPGKCLDSTFTDDSAGYPPGATPGVGSSGSGSGSGTTATTKPPTSTTSGGATSTSTGGGQTSTTTGGGGGTATTVGGGTGTTTKPTTATTAPPQTSPPQTSPPQTSPPQTSPPATNPPPPTTVEGP